MKKTLFFALFIVLAASSFAQNITNRHLFIEGFSERNDQLEFFLFYFAMEARSVGYTITRTRQEAAYTFRFTVVPNTITVQGVQRPAPPEENQYYIRIILINNRNNVESLSFNFYFSELDEMLEYIQFLFYRATVFIPAIAGEKPIDRNWQNKWLYLRTSFNYPIVFHALQPAGLEGGGQSLYGFNEQGEMDDFIPLDNKIQPQPGFTIGLEVQFLNFMSFEANLQSSLGNNSTYSFFNWAAGGELKFLIKTDYYMIKPYMTGLYQFNTSPIFKEFPSFSFGGGIQIAARGGRSGAFFVDLKYLHSFSDVIMINPYIDPPLAPNPSEIHYKRFVIGAAIGYLYGNLDRK